MNTNEVCCKDCKFCTDFVKGLCKTPEDKVEHFTASRNEYGTCSLFQRATIKDQILEIIKNPPKEPRFETAKEARGIRKEDSEHLLGLDENGHDERGR